MFQKVLILVVFLTLVYSQVCFPGDTCIRSADDSSDFKNTNLRRTIKTNSGDFFQEIHFWQSFSTLSNTEKRKIYFWSNEYHIFISGQKCLTTSDSPDSNAECKFPWKFNGNLLNGCTDETDPDGK